MSFYANELIFASTAATEILESFTDLTNSLAASMFLASSESFPAVNAIAPSANTSTDFSSTFACPQLIATASVEFAFSITITPTVNEETNDECPGRTPNSPSFPGRVTVFTSSLNISPLGVTIDNLIVSMLCLMVFCYFIFSALARTSSIPPTI